MNSYFTGFIWGWGRCLGAKRTWVHRTWLWNFQKCRIIGVTKGHNPYLPYLCCKILHQFFQDSIKLATKNTDLSCVSTFWQFCSPQGKGHEHEALVMLGLPHVAHTNNWVHKWPWRCYSSLGNLPHFPWKFTRKKKIPAVGKHGKRIYHSQHPLVVIQNSAVSPHLPLLSWQPIQANVCRTAL